MRDRLTEVSNLFNDWNAAIQTGDPDCVVSLYAFNGILIPTLSNDVRSSHAEIRAYFVEFLKKQPRATLSESYVRAYGDTGSILGFMPLHSALTRPQHTQDTLTPINGTVIDGSLSNITPRCFTKNIRNCKRAWLSTTSSSASTDKVAEPSIAPDRAKQPVLKWKVTCARPVTSVVRQQKPSMIEPPEIINSTKPILYETGYDEWPYAYAGSCFPVRWKNILYIVSAFHCFEKHQIDPEATLYPIPIKSDHFFGFCCKLRARVNETNDLKHCDQILLQVSPDVHSIEELNSVNAFDLSNTGMTISLSSREILDVWLRGFLLENPDHAVDYDACKIKQQAYVTNGFVSSRKSLFDCCHMLRVKTPIKNGMSPNGMSGSAVYVVDKDGGVKFGGTVIEYNFFTDEFLVIDSTVLCELLKTENA